MAISRRSGLAVAVVALLWALPAPTPGLAAGAQHRAGQPQASTTADDRSGSGINRISEWSDQPIQAGLSASRWRRHALRFRDWLNLDDHIESERARPLWLHPDGAMICDEQATTQLGSLEHAVETPVAAHHGSMGLRLTPTATRETKLRLIEPLDPGNDTHLSFWIRAESGHLKPKLQIDTGTPGPAVPIDNYVPDGCIDSRWRRAEIPLAELIGVPTRIEALIFSARHPFFIDDIRLMNPDQATLTGWSTPSNRVISTLFRGLDAAAVRPEGYFVIHADDTTAGPIALFPEAVGVESFNPVLRGPEVEPDVLVAVHLLLSAPLEAHRSYQIEYGVPAPSGLLTEGALSVAFDPNGYSSAVRIANAGYQPESTKHAHVGEWLGDAGAMPLDDLRFELRERGVTRSSFPV